MLLIKSWIDAHIIVEVEMIKADATNVKISRRKSRKRRRCESKSCKWESCWESWLSRFSIEIKDVCHFLWWKDRFLKQNRQSKSMKRYWFRERVLLKTFRFWAFQTLTNHRFLIDCRRKVENDSWLIERAWSIRLTSDTTLRKRTTFLMLRQIKWFRFFSKHAMKIMNCKIRFREQFSKLWYCERNDAIKWCNLHTLWCDLVRREWEIRTLRWHDWFWDDEWNKWQNRRFWRCDKFEIRDFWSCC